MKVESEALKETIHIKNAKATPLEYFNAIVKPFYKSTGLTVDKIIGNFIKPMVQCGQKGIKRFDLSLSDSFCPSQNRLGRRFLGMICLKNLGQLFT
jgi:hypothetical protein